MGGFGDSITASPSYLAPLAASLGVQHVEYAPGGYKTSDLLLGLGPQAAREVATQSVLLCGINDVINDVAAATIEANLALLMAQLTNPHVVCLLPFGNHADWTGGREAVRVAVNDWIKFNTANYTDAELVMGDGDPTQPVLLPAYDSGDGLHLSTDGDTALAGAIFAQSFEGVAL